ncbi:hypothetical protein [Lyngbya sp. CCY1209]|uniref:hypothetical protein n=1 Tax=Lyngbya sp. CCY1209 TaxID=2886103 RepID=UPI002D20BB48|nr:hypothetical protein [Lyngbya sp. CCY1209]MEB3886817.1 hypothetical protein [Lyngbya sp. CCY1209]
MAQLYGMCDLLKYRSGEPIRVLKSIAPHYTNSLDFGEEFFSVAVRLLLIVGDKFSLLGFLQRRIGNDQSSVNGLYNNCYHF